MRCKPRRAKSSVSSSRSSDNGSGSSIGGSVLALSAAARAQKVGDIPAGHGGISFGGPLDGSFVSPLSESDEVFKGSEGDSGSICISREQHTPESVG